MSIYQPSNPENYVNCVSNNINIMFKFGIDSPTLNINTNYTFDKQITNICAIIDNKLHIIDKNVYELLNDNKNCIIFEAGNYKINFKIDDTYVFSKSIQFI